MEREYLLLGTKEGERVDSKGLYLNRSSSFPNTMDKFMSVSTEKKVSEGHLGLEYSRTDSHKPGNVAGFHDRAVNLTIK